MTIVSSFRRVASLASIVAAYGAFVTSAFAQSPSAPTRRRHIDARGRTWEQVCPVDPVATGANRYRCFAYRMVDAGGGAGPFPAAGVQSLSGMMGPQEIQKAYGLTTVPPSGGAVVAVVDIYGYADALADLNVYRTQYGIPALPTCSGKVPVPGGPPCFANIDEKGNTSAVREDPTGNWTVEAALDVQMVSAACPDCSIVLVSVNPNADPADGLRTVASLVNGLSAISNSWGGPEPLGVIDAPYNLPGVLVVASSGDDNYLSEGRPEFSGSPSFPASSPHVLAVGGTTPSPDSTSPRGVREVVWSNSRAGGGSGCSTVFAKPAWQSKLINPSCAKRASVDVSAAASYEPNLTDPSGMRLGGIAAYVKGGWGAMGGTSAAAPMVAGILSRVKLAKKIANDLSVLYDNPSAFNDITTGNNDPTGSCHDVNCTAGTGWDGPTGMGTPNAAALCALSGACTGAPDAGPGEDGGGAGTDGGAAGADGGAAGTDGGAAGTDGGPSSRDGGTKGDASASSVPPDGGDGDDATPTEVGCACTTASTHADLTGLAGLFVGLAYVVRRRSR